MNCKSEFRVDLSELQRAKRPTGQWINYEKEKNATELGLKIVEHIPFIKDETKSDLPDFIEQYKCEFVAFRMEDWAEFRKLVLTLTSGWSSPDRSDTIRQALIELELK